MPTTVIGGLITATSLTLFIFPLIFYVFYRKRVTKAPVEATLTEEYSA